MEMGRRQRVIRVKKGGSGEARRVATDWRAAPREGAMCNRVRGNLKIEGIWKFLRCSCLSLTVRVR
jgi:hypothetical protein